jgi:hypothetical protein
MSRRLRTLTTQTSWGGWLDRFPWQLDLGHTQIMRGLKIEP